MKRRVVLLCLSWVFAIQCLAVAAAAQAAESPKLDQYGGLMSLTCSNRTGHFILTKVNNHWWFCTPKGHAFISMNVGAVEPATKGTVDCEGKSAYDLLLRKYGDATFHWASQTLRRMTAWGFNSLGQDSIGLLKPTYNCRNCPWPGGSAPIRLPFVTRDMPATYASVNLYGYAPGAVKDIMNGLNGNYKAYRAMLADVFDPNLGTWWNRELADHRQPAIQDVVSNSPWVLGVFTDDSDYFWGSGAGTDFITWPESHSSGNIGYIVMISSPTQTYEQSTQYRGQKILYSDTKVYSKANDANPQKPCSISDPCSLRDYLWQKYKGDINALNRAWGSRYSTFDSSGKPITGEAIGTGDGTRTVFHQTLAHAPISPNSLLVSVGGTPKAGDCAWFHANCRASSNTGSIGSPDRDLVAQEDSSINYRSGAITVTFAKAPPKGTVITASYVSGGWMAGGAGLMDESGSSPWMGSNNFCLQKSSSPYTVCVPGKYGVPNANRQTGADLDEWIAQVSAEYFKTMRNGLKHYSGLPYLGLDTIGSWDAPASSSFLRGAGPYLDGAFVNLSADLPNKAQASAMYSYLTQYLGDVPLMDFIVVVAQPDSSMSCHRWGVRLPNQQARGAEYLTTVQTFLTTPSYNKDYPWVGFDWWAWQDFQNANQGLVSIHDNAYDGKEAVRAVGKDPWGYPTGGEAADYGDALSAVKRANAFWYSLAH